MINNSSLEGKFTNPTSTNLYTVIKKTLTLF